MEEKDQLFASQTTLTKSAANGARKVDFHVVSLAECWPVQCHNGDSNAPKRHLTRIEKLAALVRLLRSHWTTAEHYCLEYLERVTITDPQLYLVALRNGTPIGM